MSQLSDYNFQLGYRKGKELVLADFLSRNPQVIEEDPRESVSVSFGLVEPEMPAVDDVENIAFPSVEVQHRPVTRAYAWSQNIIIPPVTDIGRTWGMGTLPH